MSEKQKQLKRIMTNDTSQRSVAMSFMWWEVQQLLYYKFTAESVWKE